MRGIARAFARNPVFANIVLLLIFLSGYLAARNMTRETFPDFSIGDISIAVVYPGADPAVQLKAAAGAKEHGAVHNDLHGVTYLN